MYDIRLTPEALKAAAAWVEAGEGLAAVELLVDDRMLLVRQGDELNGFDTDGSPASEEYLSVAPLDRHEGYPEPPDDLADAWARFQAGEHVTPGELSKLDEWRADVHEEAFNG